MSKAVTDEATKLAVEGSWPVLSTERSWKGRSLFFVMISLATATWLYPVGGYTAYYVKAGAGTLLIPAAVLLGTLLVILAILPVSTKYGIDSLVASKPFLGTNGSYIALFMLFCTVLGWNAVLTIFSGRAWAEIFISTGLLPESSRHLMQIIMPLVGIVVVYLLLRGGPSRVRDVSRPVAIGVSVLGVFILVLLLVKVGWSSISSAKPAYASGNRVGDFLLGFEVNFAPTLSWWVYLGALVRLTPSARSSAQPSLWGLAIPPIYIAIIGLYAGLAVPASGGDPTKFLTGLAGVGFGVPALLFIALANYGTLMASVYVAAVGLKLIPALQKKSSWDVVLLICMVPVAFVSTVIPGPFFDRIGTFLAFLGVGFAPLIGVHLVDYYLLRKQRLDVRSLYQTGSSGKYFFWAGFNWAAIISMAAGSAFFLYLLNPYTYAFHGPFPYISASLPSMLLAAIVYWVLSKVWVMRVHKGGYEAVATEGK